MSDRNGGGGKPLRVASVLVVASQIYARLTSFSQDEEQSHACKLLGKIVQEASVLMFLECLCLQLHATFPSQRTALALQLCQGDSHI